YGQEFSKADIDAGNASAHVDQTAHGTHVAGIAAANGDSIAAYKGAAPKAGIIAVSLNFNQGDDTWLSSIADAVDYIFSKADSLNQPCVINISAGTYLGSHDGKDLQAQAIDNLITAQNGRMVVAAAGNAGNYPLHLRHTLNNDTLFTWFRQTSANPIYIEFWSDTADLNGVEFTLGADQTSPGFQDRAQQNWTGITSHLGVLGYDTIWSYNGNRLATVQSYGQLAGDRYCMSYAITPDSATYYFRLMTKGSGKTDLWSFEMVSTGLPNVSIYPAIIRYKLPDLQQNICSSFQCSDVVLCVGQYVNRNNYIDVNGNVQTFATIEGALAVSSSRGPTRDGRSKPDITSTGEVTLSALKLSSVAWFMANQPFKLAQSGIHIRDGGTSSAAPVVAGAIALYFQKNPQAGWQDIRNRVLLCSKRDNFTGNNLPNNNWGYGKLDALSMTAGCTALSLEESNSPLFSLFPNPAHSMVQIEYTGTEMPASVALYNSIGQFTGIRYSLNTNKPLQLNLSDLPDGLYFFVVSHEGGRQTSIPLLIR
ncbi:MAG: S8 family peptidase, partial [Bacteroidia bacterium]|nr:S8 family peptidase [Bacteroidia bacterium]